MCITAQTSLIMVVTQCKEKKVTYSKKGKSCDFFLKHI
jgi:hypothetical protein